MSNIVLHYILPRPEFDSCQLHLAGGGGE